MNGLLEFSGKLNFKKKCFTICRSLFHSILGILGGRGNQGCGVLEGASKVHGLFLFHF